MIRNSRPLKVAAACLAVLILGACAGTNAGSQDSAGPTGEPAAGGTARVIQLAEPRSLDPATLANAWAVNAFLGNALYGTLMTNDEKTGEVQFTMAEGFATNDGGATFELTLRPGLEFSDGSPLDAGVVKFNWDRIKDPANGSIYGEDASMVASSEVVDATTLKVTMATAIPNYAQTVLSSSMNWIASPTALQRGPRAFDANPVGAGPFILKSWARQNAIELVKNPRYWDAPKPYLDGITLRTSNDTGQRLNTVISGGADVVIETNPDNYAKASDAGFPTDVMELNGGTLLAMNTRRAPFNDIRARKAVAAALDLDAISLAMFHGNGKTAPTLYADSSPRYSDKPLVMHDKETAQRLFNELAAEGKPVSFTFKAFPSTENRVKAESVQAQLSAFDNVKVQIEIIDLAKVAALRASYDYDMVVSSAHFLEPDPTLWAVFHGDSRRNVSRIDDAELNAALRAGRVATTDEERKAAYDAVQDRLIALTPVIFTERTSPGAISAKNVGGLTQYGNGSLLPEELWIQQ